MAGVVVEFVQHSATQIVLHAHARAAQARCPHCSRASGRVHGRYVRRLADAAIGGRAVVVELLVRRFRCLNGACTAVTFAEQIEGLTTPHARKTPLLRSVLLSIACTLAGRPGARFANLLGIRVAKDTLLHLLRTMPDRRASPVRVLGVDDFALRKGDWYATILVDLETRRPIDVLPGREAEPLAAWLAGHPEVEIICRDRAGAYAEGARTGAPQAMQVADGWHLWRNLAEAVEKTVGSHHTCIRSAFATRPTTELDTARVRRPPFDPPDRTSDCLGRPRRLVARTRDRYAAVQQRLAEGKSLTAIGRELRLDHSTVRRFARATSIDELLVKAVNRQSILDEYKSYLHQRWNEGCHDIPRLHREVRELGFPGDVQTVRRYLRWSKESGLPVSPRPAPRPRRVVRWIMTDPDRLTAGDALELKEIRATCPHLDVAARHVRDFATMLHDRRGDLLSDWMDRVLADDLPALHSLVTGLRRDQDAVTAGLSSSWSSGQVEGQVTRIKLIKRQGYGRASLDLLRKRILLDL
ncbi:ISL3 family transposase [Streptomyces sp. NPDC048566]|uniref:ISL3 family transposase n=1 Tax=Streptomyces sp. NPDC048566 TaxID=3365569 RepID=UPI00371AE94F